MAGCLLLLRPGPRGSVRPCSVTNPGHGPPFGGLEFGSLEFGGPEFVGQSVVLSVAITLLPLSQ